MNSFPEYFFEGKARRNPFGGYFFGEESRVDIFRGYFFEGGAKGNPFGGYFFGGEV